MPGQEPDGGEGADTPTGTYEESFAIGAASYAEEFGVSKEEAVRRLMTQAESSGAIGRLYELAGSRLANLRYENLGEYRLVLSLTGDEAPVPALVEYGASLPLPLDIETGATVSRDQLVAAGAAIGVLLTDDDRIASLGTDPVFGTVVVEVRPDSPHADVTADLADRLTAQVGVQVTVGVAEGQVAQLDASGGRRLQYLGYTYGSYHCTSGFSVANYAGATGVLTSAHCYQAPSLTQFTYHNDWNGQQPPSLLKYFSATIRSITTSCGWRSSVPSSTDSGTAAATSPSPGRFRGQRLPWASGCATLASPRLSWARRQPAAGSLTCISTPRPAARKAKATVATPSLRSAGAKYGAQPGIAAGLGSAGHMLSVSIPLARSGPQTGHVPSCRSTTWMALGYT